MLPLPDTSLTYFVDDLLWNFVLTEPERNKGKTITNTSTPKEGGRPLAAWRKGPSCTRGAKKRKTTKMMKTIFDIS